MKHDPQGKPFFIDHNTKSTTYDDPRLKPVSAHTPTPTPTPVPVTLAPTQAPVTGPPQLNKEGLPLGWDMAVDPSGLTYFIDHNNKRTTYDDPRIKR